MVRHTPRATSDPSARTAPRQEPPLPPPPKAPPPPPDPMVTAQHALQAFWGSPGLAGLDTAVAVCRELTKAQLNLLALWIPEGSGLTAPKCTKAREIVRALAAEKGA